jgi:CRP-like cAMP-binding protein
MLPVESLMSPEPSAAQRGSPSGAGSGSAVLERETLPSGQLLLGRGQSPEWVIFVESGRIDLGILDGKTLAHQLGVLQGPAWLEASAAVLNLPSGVDAVAETDVMVRRVAMARFRQMLEAMPREAQLLLRDVAQAHRQQTEMAVSRLAKDAQARCAEWLLAHMEPNDKGAVAVRLHEPKRLIAAQLGIAPETLSRVFRYLRDRGLISGSGRVLNMLDLGGLRSLAGA